MNLTCAPQAIVTLTGKASTPASYAHGARLTVDEEGAEGSAYFSMAVRAGLPPEMPTPRPITFDRPFLFALVSDTDRPLFLGCVDEPQDSECSWQEVRHAHGETGTTGHRILMEESIPDIARIQLEEEPDWQGGQDEYFITCQVDGAMTYTHVDHDIFDAEESYSKMRAELLLCARRIARGTGFDLEAWREKFEREW